MAKKKKPKRRRTLRREAARRAEKLALDRERLASLEPGGSPERPLEVESASIVESRAVDLGCLRCEGPPRVEVQQALKHDERTIRRVRLKCPSCGARRDVWVRVVGRALN